MTLEICHEVPVEYQYCSVSVQYESRAGCTHWLETLPFTNPDLITDGQ